MRRITHSLKMLALLGGLGVAALLPGGPAVTTAFAADGDICLATGDLPGTEAAGICVPNETPAIGDACGDNMFYNGALCVANNTSCTTGDSAPGLFQAGICQGIPTPPAPITPAAPTGFDLLTSAGAAPPSGGDALQPMCVNASPFIGAGMFIVSGSTLCYSASGRDTNIYAYNDDPANSGGWNPFNPTSWNSLSMKDLYASDDVTALGTLSVYGGAQIYSANGKNGMQIDDNGARIIASDGSKVAGLYVEPDEISLGVTDGTSTSSVSATAGEVALSATDGTSTSSLTVSGGDGISLVASVATGGPAVNINGAIGATSTAAVGVMIQGDGQGAQTTPGSWADVLIASKSYGPGTGSGIAVSDRGVIVASAPTGTTYNEFGSGAGNAQGSSLTNVIGNGGAGTVTNYFGNGGSGSVTNYFGQSGTVGSVVVNEIGTAGGLGATTNRIGNTNAATSVTATAGSSSMVVIQGALDLATGQGASILSSPTQQVSGGTAVAMLGTTTRSVTIDANGRLAVINGPAPEASNALYIVNGNGVTNGVVVTERQATLSGGETTPTSFVLNDNGAQFSNSATGAPVRVSGIADSKGPFEAVNGRQLDSGLASVAALAGLPAPQPGKRNSIGVAFGQHGDGTAMALGGQSALGDSMTVKYGAAVSYSAGRTDSTATLGLGMSW